MRKIIKISSLFIVLFTNINFLHSQNVGVGTLSPLSKFHIKGQLRVDTLLSGSQNDSILTVDNNGVFKKRNISNFNKNIYNTDGSLDTNRTVNQNGFKLTFKSNLKNAFSVDDSTFSVNSLNNNIGFGTTSPESRLQVCDGDVIIGGQNTSNSIYPKIQLVHPVTNDSSGTSIWFRDRNYLGYSIKLNSADGNKAGMYGLNFVSDYGTNDDFNNWTAASMARPALFLSKYNNVGIGNSYPYTIFHIDGNRDNTFVYPTTNQLSNDVVVNTFGMLGVGTINPRQKFHVMSGNALIGGNDAGSKVNPFLYLQNNTNADSSGATLAFYDNDGKGFHIQHNTLAGSKAGQYGLGITYNTQVGPLANIPMMSRPAFFVSKNNTIGIGTSSPQSTFHIDARLDNNINTAPSASQADNDLFFNTSGSLGIGTVNPWGKLHVEGGNIVLGSSIADPTIFIQNNSNTDGSGAMIKLRGANGWGYTLKHNSAPGTIGGDEGLAFTMEATTTVSFLRPTLFLSSGSFMGVGTARPKSLFHVDGAKDNSSTVSSTEALNDLVYTSTGRLGIGTISPTKSLHIFGGDALIGGLGTGSQKDPTLTLFNNNASDSSGGTISFKNSNQFGMYLRLNSGAGVKSGDFGLAIGSELATTLHPGIFINSSNFVGIGNANPLGVLHVDSRFDNPYGDSTKFSDDIFVDKTSGYMSIGKISPTERLDIVGNLRLSGAFKPNNLAGTSGQVLTSKGVDSAPVWSTINTTNIYNSDGTLSGNRVVTMGTNSISFTSNIVNAFTIDTNTFSVNSLNNRIGIGTSAPTEKVDIVGNVKFSGALMPNNTAGLAGQVLTSAGPGVPPTWSNVGANATATFGDIKTGIQTADHNGWINLNGRLLNTLTATQQIVAASLGLVNNLPDASNAVLIQNAAALGSISGSNSRTIAQNQLPNVNLFIANGDAAAPGFPFAGNGYLCGKGIYIAGDNNSYWLASSGTLPTLGMTSSLNGNVAQQSLDITPKSLSVKTFIYLGN